MKGGISQEEKESEKINADHSHAQTNDFLVVERNHIRCTVSAVHCPVSTILCCFHSEIRRASDLAAAGNVDKIKEI